MYRVETKTLRELLRMWLEDNPERQTEAQQTPNGTAYTSITDEYGCVWMGDDDVVPPHLIDRVIMHYLNERSSCRDQLVSCRWNDEVVRLVWREAE